MVETGTIYCGKANQVLSQFPEGSVDLIYMDPPFFSNRNYELVWGNGYELKAYEDRWKGGIENYIAWMEPVIRECQRVLKDTGTLYLHCDWHANAHLRILLDRIFGENHFLNEVVWCYSGGGTPRKDYPRKHDTIFRYAKGNDYTFNVEYRPYKEGIIPTHSTGEALDMERGTPITDWWTDIKIVTPFSANRKEKLGYPTQKPEALLERIVKVSSNPTDIVLDPMSGGGTTVAVAQRLGRRWVAIDISPLACKMMQSRLRKLGATPMMIGMPMSVKAMKALEPFAFQERVLELMYGHPNPRKTGDMGVDGWLLDGRPVQVKQSEGIGRVPVDNFETALRRLKKKAGIIVAFSFGKGAHEEVARAKNHEDLDIELKTVRAILDDMGAHDEELEALDWVEHNGGDPVLPSVPLPRAGE